LPKALCRWGYTGDRIRGGHPGLLGWSKASMGSCMREVGVRVREVWGDDVGKRPCTEVNGSRGLKTRIPPWCL
jgi:hypothetical protein